MGKLGHDVQSLLDLAEIVELEDEVHGVAAVASTATNRAILSQMLEGEGGE